MPRSARNRQRNEQKGKPTVKEVPPPESEQEEEDLIAGGITRAMWDNVLIQEEGDEIVGEIMDELLSRVMDGCYKLYTERQRVPYTVSWARSYLTESVESQILCLDEGEGAEELCGTEDSEPLPALPDCFAQGCVSTVHTVIQLHNEKSNKPQTEKTGTSQLPKRIFKESPEKF